MTKLVKDESGISRTVLIVGIVIVLAGIGFGVWGLTGSSTKPTNTSNVASTTSASTTSNNSQTTACINAYHDSELCSFSGNLNIFNTAFSASGTAANSTGSASFVMKNDGKGNRQISYTTASRQINVITLDGNEYVQTGAGTSWLEYPAGSSNLPSSVPTDPASYFNLTISGNSASEYTFTKLGNANCGSSSCVEYQVSVTAKPSITQDLYFNPGTHMLMKWSYSDSATGGSVNSNFTYEPVTITQPSPVQQVTT